MFEQAPRAPHEQADAGASSQAPRAGAAGVRATSGRTCAAARPTPAAAPFARAGLAGRGEPGGGSGAEPDAAWPRAAPADPLAAILARSVAQRPAAERLLQRLPSVDDDPTVKADGTYWDRKEMKQIGSDLVPKRMTAYMRNPMPGTVPSVDPPGWHWLRQHTVLKGSWVRFHIINQLLGGPGHKAWNLVPTSVAVNGAFCRGIENDAKDSAITQGEWTYVDVRLKYDAAGPAPIPSRIIASWGVWNPMSDEWTETKELELVNADIALISQNIFYLRGVNITQQEIRRRRGEPASDAPAVTHWLQTYRQTSDSDQRLYNAFDAAFPEGDLRWLDQVWVDEAVDGNGYEAVVKVLPRPASQRQTGKRKRSDSSGAKHKKKKQKTHQ